MTSLPERLATALRVMIERSTREPLPATATEIAKLGFRTFQPGVPGFRERHVETIIVDLSHDPPDNERRERLADAVRSLDVPHPLVVLNTGPFSEFGCPMISASDMLLQSVPWPAASGAPQESTVPGDLDLDQLDTNYHPRVARLYRDNRSPTVGNADEILTTWLEEPDSHPLVLRGIRGSGKTWALLHFSHLSWVRFKQSQGARVPVIYVNLGKPEVSQIVLAGWPSGHSALALLAAHYGDSTLPWNGEFLAALLDTGAIGLALDGFDELYKQPTDDQVRALGLSLATQFAPGAKILVAGRSVFVRLLPNRQQAWLTSGSPGSWLVLDLLPLGTTSDGLPPQHLLTSNSQDLHLAQVVAAAQGHPALRAELERASSGLSIDASALRRAIIATFVEFNLRHERTRDKYVRRFEDKVVRAEFSEADRCEFLAELAWHMAERQTAAIAIDRLPRRLARQFNLDSHAMRLDVRAQLALEQKSNGAAQETEELTFAIPLGSNPGAKSVDQTLTGAMFLAEFLATRLDEGLATPGLGLPYFLRFLGRVPLSDASAVFLRAHMADTSIAGRSRLLERARIEAISQIRTLAAAGGGRVFVSCLRHLASNLRRLGAFNQLEEEALDPWRADFLTAAGSDRSVLIPAAASPRLTEFFSSRPSLRRSGARIDDEPFPTRPFFLGAHEVTNGDYETFVWSDDGTDWRVRRVTRAASKGGVPPSPFAKETNEYHLYLWLDNNNQGYRPPTGTRDLPVTYVSWNAAAAYCDWLSASSGRSREYGFEPHRRVAVAKSGGQPGFRLPTLGEWLWAAYSSALAANNTPEAEYPWDWVAPGVALEDLPETLRRRRQSMEATQLESGKLVAPVLEDDILDTGVSGLVGNVKEWVDDCEAAAGSLDTLPSKHVIAGATAYLGLDSFRFGYYVSLFSQNTNPDVGFRVARSLSDDELRALEAREAQLRALDLI